MAGFGFAVGDGGFVDAEARGDGGERGPIGAFVGEEEVVDIAMWIRTTAESDADFGRDRESGEDLLHRAIENGLGNREQAHEE